MDGSGVFSTALPNCSDSERLLRNLSINPSALASRLRAGSFSNRFIFRKTRWVRAPLCNSFTWVCTKSLVKNICPPVISSNFVTLGNLGLISSRPLALNTGFMLRLTTSTVMNTANRKVRISHLRLRIISR